MKDLTSEKGRAAFKRELGELIRPLGVKYGVAFRFGRIDFKNEWRDDGGKMNLHIDAVGELSHRIYHKEDFLPGDDGTNLWDSPAAVALVDSMKRD